MSRISEIINLRSPKIIYILFGDELYLTEKNILNFINYVKKNKDANCWHLLTSIKNEDKNDKNVVKCKLNKNREIVDFCRSYKNEYNYKCVGVFAFKRNILKNYNKFKNSDKEIKMKVEQFKLLENKVAIKSMIIKNITNSINSIKDLKSKN